MGVLKSLSIGRKITAVILMLCAIAVTILLLGQYSLRRVNTRLNRIVTVEAEKIRLGARVNRNLAEIRIAEKNLLLATSKEEAMSFAQSAREAQSDLAERSLDLERLVDAEGRTLLATFRTHYEVMTKHLHHIEGDVLEGLDRTHDAESGEQRENTADLLAEAVSLSHGRAREAYDRAAEAMEAIVSKNDTDLDRFKGATDRYVAQAFVIQMTSAAALVAVGLAMALAVAKSISTRLRSMVNAANRIASGSFDTPVAIDGTDELGKLAEAMSQMQASLRQAAEDDAAEGWLKNGMLRLTDHTRGIVDVASFGKVVISEVARYVEAPVGALYQTVDGEKDEAPALNRVVGYARGPAATDLPKQFGLGQGLVGQAAEDREPILVQDIPDDYVRVASGVGDTLPRALFLVPLLYEDRLKGVLELGLLMEPTDSHRQYLEQIAPRIAIAIETLQNGEALAKALEKEQALTEQLQEQQEELEAANEELEEQTQQLQASEQELKAQGEALAAANEYKSEFLASMSHDLRTPLNSLLVLADLLAQNKTGNLDDEQLESLGVIGDSGRDLLALIDDILDLSKIEAGRMELHIEAINVGDIVDSIRSRFLPLAEEKGLELDVSVDDEAPPVLHSDRKQIERVLQNLLSNALKFTEQGTITVRFDREREAIRNTQYAVRNTQPATRNTQFLSISVQDTGTGIPADKLTTIFQAFERLGAATGGARGTGLGLSIAGELADLLGGEIQVASTLGEGSTFTLYLPIETGHRPRKPERGTATDKPAPPSRSRVRGKSVPFISDDRADLGDDDRVILVVEDDARFAQILLNQCHERGFKCVAAATGEEGMELAAERAPDAVLLDLHLPGIDGWAVLDRLKGDMSTRHIPVHVISVEDDPTGAVRRGALGHLTKPAKLEDLAAVFRKVKDVISRKVRRLMIVSGSQDVRNGLTKMFANGVVEAESRPPDEQAAEALKAGAFDCAVVDLELPGDRALSLLRELSEAGGATRTPIIAYSEKPPTREQARLLRECAESVVIKGAASDDRLLDEVSLFLHRVVGGLPEAARRGIAGLYQSDEALKGRTVLIVDDDMRNTFALARALEDRGANTLSAENGQKALEVLQKEADVELVLMDLMMPVMDGYEAMKRMRQDERFRDLPIIALTAKAMKKDREEAMAAGANDFLPKPVDLNRLFSMMRMWLYG